MAKSAVPIRDSVGAAFGFVRENLRVVLLFAAIGAGAAALIGVLALAVPQLGLLALIAGVLAQACVYAAFIGRALHGADVARGRWIGDGARVLAAMAVVGLFLILLLFVASLPVMMVLLAGPLGPFADDLKTAGDNQAAVMDVMLRFTEQNPGAVFALMFFYAAVWLLFTSRFYIAAPASVDRQRVLSFETWPWTRGAMVRITLARLMLLAPAYILVGAVTHLIGRLFGFDTLNGAQVAAGAAANPVGFTVFNFLQSYLILLYAALEAGLSTYLYRGLRPAPAQPPA